MPIAYAQEQTLSAADYIDCVGRSSLGSARPLANPTRIAQMLENSNLIITARDETSALLGVFRGMTDWHWVCYCADLAVVEGQQGKGIGKALMARADDILGPRVGITLLAMPEAEGFYRAIGMTQPMAAFFRPRIDRS